MCLHELLKGRVNQDIDIMVGQTYFLGQDGFLIICTPYFLDNGMDMYILT